MIHIQNAIDEKWPNLQKKPIYPLLIKLLKSLMHENEINEFMTTHQHLNGFAFLDQVLEHFDFSYQVNHKQLQSIPAEGRVIIVANHPIGSLDGLALLKLVRSVRPDVKIVANDLLSKITPLQEVFLSVDNMGEKGYKSQLKAMMSALQDEQAVIIFPAGEVSRIRPNGVRDGKWKAGFLKLAEKSNAPILPILIDAKNSQLFYALSMLYKPLGTLMLVQEMFNKKAQQIEFHIGKPIPQSAIATWPTQGKTLANQFRKHLYRLAKPKKLAKKPFIPTLETIAHPVERKALKNAIQLGQKLGETSDGKIIYLFDYDAQSPVMQEIGRLREFTFRSVEEGTGKRLDLDAFDVFYQHLVLWDAQDWEIVGAYRLGNCAKILHKHIPTISSEESLPAGNLSSNQALPFYSATLFEFQEDFYNYLPQSIELGRSFVQPKYWGKRSLDYLWYGIGAYLKQHPEIKYLFGPVTLSNAYPGIAKEMIASFYLKQFGDYQSLVKATRPFEISANTTEIAKAEFGHDYKDSYKKLNTLLGLQGVKVPTLFKQYSELCEDQGCRFIDFNIDPDFSDCIDAFIFVELDKIKAKKRERYMGEISVGVA